MESKPPLPLVHAIPTTPRASIEYCIKCRWLPRAGMYCRPTLLSPQSRSFVQPTYVHTLNTAWVAQELLTTFSTLLGEVAIIPGTDAIFQKQSIRDIIAPDLPLGHSDSKVKSKPTTSVDVSGTPPAITPIDGSRPKTETEDEKCEQCEREGS
ncbi:hypothetical protein BC936DRAFT_148962 [Jimgerdemannia flammicorona]|uniref:Uncharacterized protein n=1 Tax=Jimgerdemannia flammicorona TaxID=994334 RepID=A0A433D1X4_9FUNG|nr:hypothetical protein BC936DRAFT_148962 [Jimgerdemannia flammicorona]